MRTTENHYRISRTPERIETSDERRLMRVFLDPVSDQDEDSVIGTVEELEGADGRVRPVSLISVVNKESYECVSLNKRDLNMAVARAASEFMGDDESALDDLPAW